MPLLSEGGPFAKLRITPAGPFCQVVETFTLRLAVKDGWIVRYMSRDRATHSVIRTTSQLDVRDVTSQIAKLKSAKVPVVLVGEMPLDGELIELTVYGENGTLSVAWWTIVPHGAEAIGDFVDWLRRAVRKH